jgi:hypothetical protein
MIEGEDCEEEDRMIIDKGNQSIWRRPSAVSLCPPQITHELTWIQGHCSVESNDCLSYDTAFVRVTFHFF